MAIKSILLPEGERASVLDVKASVDQPDPAAAASSEAEPAPAPGLRRSMGSRAYSHLDLQSLEYQATAPNRISVQQQQARPAPALAGQH